MSQKYRMGTGEKVFLSLSGVVLTAGIIGIVVAVVTRNKSHSEEITTQVSIPPPTTAGLGTAGSREQEQTQQGDSTQILNAVEDILLVPGQRVGAIVLGQPIHPSVMTKLGKPDITNISGPQAVDSGNYTWENRLNVKLGDGRSQFNVYQILVESGPYQTDKGIRIGSTMAEVEAAYPNAKQSSEAIDGGIILTIPGLIFGMDSEGRKVINIGVHPIR